MRVSPFRALRVSGGVVMKTWLTSLPASFLNSSPEADKSARTGDPMYARSINASGPRSTATE